MNCEYYDISDLNSNSNFNSGINSNVSDEIDMDIDNLVSKFNYNASVIWKPKQHFVKDIDVIIEAIGNSESIINLDIYETLVSCGHNLTWDQDYFISQADLNWLKNDEGKKYFLTNLNEKKPINTILEYRAVTDIHFKLTELFELQLGD